MTVGNTLANEVFLENCDDMTCRVATNFLKFIQKNVLLIVLCSLLNCVEEKNPSIYLRMQGICTKLDDIKLLS